MKCGSRPNRLSLSGMLCCRRVGSGRHRNNGDIPNSLRNPKFGQDIREKTLPHETGQERALNFNKGCYIGQEIVERIRSRGNVHQVHGFVRRKGPALIARDTSAQPGRSNDTKIP